MIELAAYLTFKLTGPSYPTALDVVEEFFRDGAERRCLTPQLLLPLTLQFLDLCLDRSMCATSRPSSWHRQGPLRDIRLASDARDEGFPESV
jgi:hypothetical protein